MYFHHIVTHSELLTTPNLLTLIAIIIASVIWFRQIRISNRQNELSSKQLDLSRRQFEIDAVRYAIDKAITNKAELVEVVVNGKKALETETGEKTKTFLNNQIDKANIDIWGLNKKIPTLIKKYHRILARNPNDFKLEEE